MENTILFQNILNEETDSIDFSKLKKQLISSINVIGDKVILKTQNFEISINKEDIKQIKQFEDFPKIIDENEFKFDGYSIYDRYTQLSPKKTEFKAYIYFPSIDYSFGNIDDFIINGIYNRSNNSYKEIKEDKLDHRDVFAHIVSRIKKLNTITLDDLQTICDDVNTLLHSKSTYISNTKILAVESGNGYIIKNQSDYRQYTLTKGKPY